MATATRKKVSKVAKATEEPVKQEVEQKVKPVAKESGKPAECDKCKYTFGKGQCSSCVIYKKHKGL